MVILIFCILIGAIKSCCKKKEVVSAKTVQGEEEDDEDIFSVATQGNREEDVMRLESIVPESELNPPHIEMG